MARILVRGSTNKQVLTLDHQEVHSQQYAESQGWVVDRIYQEAGTSSSRLAWDERPELCRALREAQNGEYDFLVVWCGDRLSRQPGEQELLHALFRRCGVEIRYADPKAPKAERSHLTDFLNTIMSHVAHMEIDTLVRRVKEITRLKAEKGLWLGGYAPYGYHYDKATKKFSTVPGHIEVVREIFRMAIEEKKGALRIARHLNESGQRNSQGRLFSATAIRRILKNKFYCGHLIARITDPDDPSQVNVIDVRSSLIEAVVSEEDWERIQENHRRWANREIPSRQFSTARLFSGLLYCSCGRRMEARTHTRRWTRKDGSTAVFRADEYLCRNGREGQYGCTFVSSYKQHILDPALARVIADRLQFRDWTSFVAEANAVVEVRNRLLSQQLAASKQQSAAFQARIHRTVDTMAEEEDREIRQHLRDRIRVLKEQQAVFIQEEERLSRLLRQAGDQLSSLEGLEDRLKNWPTLFASAQDDAVRRRMILDVVDRVVLTPDRQARIFLKVDPRCSQSISLDPAEEETRQPEPKQRGLKLGSHDCARDPERSDENVISTSVLQERNRTIDCYHPAAIAVIRESSVQGDSPRKIAHVLNDLRIPPPEGLAWTQWTVRYAMQLLPEWQDRAARLDKVPSEIVALIREEINRGRAHGAVAKLLNKRRIPCCLGEYWQGRDVRAILHHFHLGATDQAA